LRKLHLSAFASAAKSRQKGEKIGGAVAQITADMRYVRV
jgi:hypothetical protein